MRLLRLLGVKVSYNPTNKFSRHQGFIRDGGVDRDHVTVFWGTITEIQRRNQRKQLASRGRKVRNNGQPRDTRSAPSQSNLIRYQTKVLTARFSRHLHSPDNEDTNIIKRTLRRILRALLSYTPRTTQSRH